MDYTDFTVVELISAICEIRIIRDSDKNTKANSEVRREGSFDFQLELFPPFAKTFVPFAVKCMPQFNRKVNTKFNTEDRRECSFDFQIELFTKTFTPFAVI